ncbi:MAG: glycosyltransferase family 4 protein [Candidatus Eisenbacteria bacterium]|nr:glycosyltransferase family 4 protein [Candidatus Eisenbacteria bacterium]
MARRRILFIYPWPDRTFIQKDEQILARHFDLRVLHFRRTAAFYREMAGLLWRREVDLVYLWFLMPDYASLALALCRRAGIPFALVTGGYDVASIPGIRFGNMRKPHHRRLGGWVLRNADLILPFSDFAGTEVLRWARPRGRMETVYPGIDSGFFTPPPGPAPRAGVITVGTVNPLFNIQKGMLTFARVSRLVPELEFTVIGRIAVDAAAEELRRAGGPNLRLTGRRVSDEELRGHYRSAGVYAQLSAHEGFGIAVAEGMACGCIPVVCAGTASPEVVGPCGHTVPFGEARATAAAVRAAHAAGGAERAAARERVVQEFPESRRVEALLRLLSRGSPGDPFARTGTEEAS